MCESKQQWRSINNITDLAKRFRRTPNCVRSVPLDKRICMDESASKQVYLISIDDPQGRALHTNAIVARCRLLRHFDLEGKVSLPAVANHSWHPSVQAESASDY